MSSPLIATPVGDDRTFDYRYSVLPLVFANLLISGCLVEDELRGLGENKLGRIHRASVHL
jgi:hypothetical protein